MRVHDSNGSELVVTGYATHRGAAALIHPPGSHARDIKVRVSRGRSSPGVMGK
jgi:hypothetical protein